MSEEDSVPANLLPYLSLAVNHLNVSTRMWFSHQLNPEKSTFSSSHYLQDWRGVAEALGCSPNQIENFQRCNNPMEEVLANLPLHKPQCRVGHLLEALVMCGRFDVLNDEVMEKFLEKNSRHTTPTTNLPMIEYLEQDLQIDSQSDQRNLLTVCEAQWGELGYFDAYVCFAKEDTEFVNQLMHLLEHEQKLKLFVPDRDLLSGLFEQESLSELIKERCTKMIAVLSPEYLQSEECRFLMNLASSLEPGVMGRKLVPVVVKQCTIPTILLPISMINFTNSGVLKWAWDRLVNSIKPPNSIKKMRIDERPKLLALPQPHPYPHPPPINRSFPPSFLQNPHHFVVQEPTTSGSSMISHEFDMSFMGPSNNAAVDRLCQNSNHPYPNPYNSISPNHNYPPNPNHTNSISPNQNTVEYKSIISRNSPPNTNQTSLPIPSSYTNHPNQNLLYRNSPNHNPSLFNPSSNLHSYHNHRNYNHHNHNSSYQPQESPTEVRFSSDPLIKDNDDNNNTTPSKKTSNIIKFFKIKKKGKE